MDAGGEGGDGAPLVFPIMDLPEQLTEAVLCRHPSPNATEILAHVAYCRLLPPSEVLEMQAQSLFRTLHCVATSRRQGGGVDQETFGYFFCPPILPEEDYGLCVFDRNSEAALARRFRPRDGSSKRRKQRRKRLVPDFERKLVHWRNAVQMARRNVVVLPIPQAFHRVPSAFVTVTRTRDALLARSPLGRYHYSAEDIEDETVEIPTFAEETMDVFRRTLYMLQTKMQGGARLPVLPSLTVTEVQKADEFVDALDFPISPTDSIVPEGFEGLDSGVVGLAGASSEETLVDPGEAKQELDAPTAPEPTQQPSNDLLGHIMGSTMKRIFGWAQ
jgi:hypothetical protein